MAIDRKELERRLEGWAQEYGGGRYEHVGFSSTSPLGRLADGYLPVPAVRDQGGVKTPADEVDEAVRAMEAQGYGRPAAVLRIEYFRARLTVEERVKLCARGKDGFTISRATYWDYLGIAKAYVHGRLTRERAA